MLSPRISVQPGDPKVRAWSVRGNSPWKITLPQYQSHEVESRLYSLIVKSRWVNDTLCSRVYCFFFYMTTVLCRAQDSTAFDFLCPSGTSRLRDGAHLLLWRSAWALLDSLGYPCRDASWCSSTGRHLVVLVRRLRKSWEVSLELTKPHKHSWGFSTL